MTTTARLGLELIDEDEILGYVSANEAITSLSVLTQTTVISRALTAPPGSPAEGDQYIPKATATGAWATHEDDIAAYLGGIWVFYPPSKGWMAACEAEDIFIWFNGTAWVAFPAGSGGGGTVVNLDASGSTPTTGTLPASFITYRLDGDSVILYANISGVIKASVIATLA